MGLQSETRPDFLQLKRDSANSCNTEESDDSFITPTDSTPPSEFYDAPSIFSSKSNSITPNTTSPSPTNLTPNSNSLNNLETNVTSDIHFEDSRNLTNLNNVTNHNDEFLPSTENSSKLNIPSIEISNDCKDNSTLYQKSTIEYPHHNSQLLIPLTDERREENIPVKIRSKSCQSYEELSKPVSAQTERFLDLLDLASGKKQNNTALKFRLESLMNSCSKKKYYNNHGYKFSSLGVKNIIKRAEVRNEVGVTTSIQNQQEMKSKMKNQQEIKSEMKNNTLQINNHDKSSNVVYSKNDNMKSKQKIGRIPTIEEPCIDLVKEIRMKRENMNRVSQHLSKRLCDGKYYNKSKEESDEKECNIPATIDEKEYISVDGEQVTGLKRSRSNTMITTGSKGLYYENGDSPPFDFDQNNLDNSKEIMNNCANNYTEYNDENQNESKLNIQGFPQINENHVRMSEVYEHQNINLDISKELTINEMKRDHIWSQTNLYKTVEGETQIPSMFSENSQEEAISKQNILNNNSDENIFDGNKTIAPNLIETMERKSSPNIAKKKSSNSVYLPDFSYNNMCKNIEDDNLGSEEVPHKGEQNCIFEDTAFSDEKQFRKNKFLVKGGGYNGKERMSSPPLSTLNNDLCRSDESTNESNDDLTYDDDYESSEYEEFQYVSRNCKTITSGYERISRACKEECSKKLLDKENNDQNLTEGLGISETEQCQFYDETNEESMDTLHKNISINYTLNEFEKELIVSVKKNNVKQVRNLLKLGANPETPVPGSCGNVLHKAVTLGHLYIVQTLLNHGADFESRTIDIGNSPLHLASKEGYDEIIVQLFECGAEVNGSNMYGVNPLQHALAYGRISTVNLLLRLGADPLQPNCVGETANAVAESLGYFKLYTSPHEVSLEGEAGTTVTIPPNNVPLEVTLIQGIEEGCPIKVEKCLNKGVNPNTVVPLALYWPAYASILHRAAHHGCDVAVRLLLRAGADVNSKDTVGNTPLHAAAQAGKNKVIKILLENGAEMESKSQSGMTPLHRATSKGNEFTVNLLLRRGARPDVEDDEGRTPADWARRRGFYKISRKLGIRRKSSSTLDPNNIEPQFNFDHLHALYESALQSTNTYDSE